MGAQVAPVACIPEKPHNAVPPNGTRLMRHASVQFCGDIDAISTNSDEPQTSVLIPSSSIDSTMLGGMQLEFHYQESRFAAYLLHLSNPNIHIVMVSAVLIDPNIVDYYLRLTKTPSSTMEDMRSRLKIIALEDRRPELCLTDKILQQPTTIRKIRQVIESEPFGSTQISLRPLIASDLERRLASSLGDIPIYALPKASEFLGTKAGSRQVFRDLELPHPAGTYQPVYSEKEVAMDLISVLVQVCPSVETRQDLLSVSPQDEGVPDRMVIKANEGVDGVGTCWVDVSRFLDIIQTDTGDGGSSMEDKIVAAFRPSESDQPMLRFVLPELTWDDFDRWIQSQGAVIEVWLAGVIASPSCIGFAHSSYGQTFMTSDQILQNSVSWCGATFPAKEEYRRTVVEAGHKVGDELSARGVRENFSMDCVIVDSGDGNLTAYCIELNIRWGGTTMASHAFRILCARNGMCRYDVDDGSMTFQGREKRVLFLPQKISKESYVGLMPEVVIESLETRKDLNWNPIVCKGVVLNMLPSLPAWGKIGMFCIAETIDEAQELCAKFEKFMDGLVAKSEV